ncbi:hypothetical protein PR003_g13120 [Phytophthora rubi]|uniref:Uncharacterized protein n=1 Tax=Phytophthora rubi TaxID=129364 RepID=A0A6A4F6B4_9STRA|nr:hypothetical protein PR002_g12559 [Phytophthora rubi]KAE9025890.1 hypothetical protein PR001_g12313 [Phytophthora rubi]KAE9335211.1 hypothetical protein PR003_g13120 [Phytophthora rubi]
MSRVAVLFAIFVAIFAGNSSAKILTFGGWPKTSNPLAAVAPADAVNFTAAGAHALKTAAPSLKSSSVAIWCHTPQKWASLGGDNHVFSAEEAALNTGAR